MSASTFQFDPKRVPIWGFYTVNYDYDIAKCKVCQRIIKTRRKDGTTNVWSHMRNVHPHQYKLAIRLKEQWKCMKRRKYLSFLTHLKIILRSDEYSFIESSFGGNLLVFRGYSFRRKSISNERSYWFCCRAKCTSKGILHSDGKFQLTKTEHNHKPDLKLIKNKEKLLELKKLALNLNIPGPDLLKFAGIKENVKKYLSLIRTWRSRYKKQNQSNIDFIPTLTVEAGLNYQRMASRISPKEMILHSGYLYRQDSSKGKGNHKYWRCKIKECKARAKTDEIGNFTIFKSDHDHAPLKIDKISREFRLKEKNETPCLQETGVKIRKTSGRESCEVNEKILRANSRTKHNKSQKLSRGGEQELIFPKTRLHSALLSSETFSIDDLVSETLEKNYGLTS